jgi:hypothetical protein
MNLVKYARKNSSPMAGGEVAAVQAAQALAKTRVKNTESGANLMKDDLPRPLIFRAAGVLLHSSKAKKDETTLRVSVTVMAPA